MRTNIRPIFLASGVALSFLTPAIGQQVQSLATYLPKLGWDGSTKGPLVVVDAEHVRSKNHAESLASFDRQVMSAGKMSVIAPTHMVLIDDSFSRLPDFYDGLPRQSKVMYLLTTLTPEQLKKANTDGIGLGDLSGEQVRVFKSLLPPRVTWHSYKISEAKGADQEMGKGAVPAEKIPDMKLKVQAGLSFHLTSAAEPNGGYNPIDSREISARAGETVITRDQEEERANPDAFGLDFHRSVPNTSKPSQLNYEEPRYDAKVALPAQGKIQDLLNLVGKRCEVEILADIRVSALSIQGYGSDVRCGDLLKSLALAVTGTYRKVGDAYVLTSDLIGMGARQLKFAAWDSATQTLLATREMEWRQGISKSGTLAKIGFDSQDKLAPDEVTQTRLDAVNDKYENDHVPVAELTPAIRTYLGNYIKGHPDQSYDSQNVGLHSEVLYGFVLPDGQVLEPEGRLGEHSMFQPFGGASRVQDEKPVPPYTLAPAGKRYLIVRIESETEATATAFLARKHGFGELWVETHQKKVLLACLATGMPTQLFIRPWAGDANVLPPNLDRNILGDSGKALEARRAKEQAWIEAADSGEKSGAGPSSALYDMVNPSDPGLSQRWIQLADLARTPGLTGVVLVDTEPSGFEGVDARMGVGGYARWLGPLHDGGYSDKMRLEFLREHGVDPIDISIVNQVMNFDLEQPFFLDYGLGPLNGGIGRPNPAMASMPDAWMTYRAKANLQATQKLLQALEGVTTPFTVMPRKVAIQVPLYEGRMVSPWRLGDDLPTYDTSNRVVAPGTVGLYVLPAAPSDVAFRNLGWGLKSGMYPVAVDMSSVGAAKVAKLIETWFPAAPAARGGGG
jgi:hypothetical protein